MLKTLTQYVTMACGLLAMYLVLAFLRANSSSNYLSQLATFLIIIAFSTPLEGVIANLVFHFRSKLCIEQEQSDFQLLIVLVPRIFIFSLISIAIFSLMQGALIVGTAIALALAIGGRLLESSLRVILLSRGRGYFGLLVVNAFTCLKWVGTFLAFICGWREFTGLAAAHALVSGLSITVLLSGSAIKSTPLRTNTLESAVSTYNLDFVSFLATIFGVIAYQTDKIVANIITSPDIYGRYVILCSLVFVGPYLLAPIFVQFQQKILSKNPSTSADDWGSSIIRLTAIAVALGTLPLLLIMEHVPQYNQKVRVDWQMFLVIVASYLNSVAHISYLRFQAVARPDLILRQNVASFIAAICTGFLLITFNNNLFALPLASAALAQYLYGEFSSKNLPRIGGVFLQLVPLFSALAVLLFGGVLVLAEDLFAYKSIVAICVVVMFSLWVHICLEARAFSMPVRAYVKTAVAYFD